ncbi:Uncharacterised protein [Streptococcus pneumoniae]|nr:Uncharacterised protein [Streptococcus pneumoniae]CWL73073.1 Uncharacterised protein [Streptococcus pneumoniae]
MSVMEHLFKFLLLAPYFYFDNWIEKANRNSKFFPIFYYFYWFYIPFYSLFSLAWTVVSVLFFNTVLRNVTDIKLWGIWFLFILLAIGMNWLTYSCFKEMFRLVVISKFFTQDLLVWFLGLLPLGIHFKTVALFFLLAQLMMLYLLLSYLIALISAGAGFSFFLYFLAFVGQEWMMDHIVTVYLLLLSLLVMLIVSRLEEKFKKG